jgi:cell division septal protein FtsQ
MPKRQSSFDKPQIGASRFRVNPKIGGAILALIALALCILSIRVICNWLYFDNTFFRLETIEITTDGDAKLKNAVRAYVTHNGAMPFKDLLTHIDIKKLREDLLVNNADFAPRLSDVAIRRIFPNKLQVSVVSRTPVATIAYRAPEDGKLHTIKVDSQGYVLPADVPSKRKRIPYVVGVVAPNAEFLLGHPTSNLGVKAFLSFLKEVSLNANHSLYEVQFCRLDKLDNHQMTLQLEARGPFRPSATVIIPTEDIATNLERINIVVNLRMEQNQTISYINAKYEKIPVKP